MTPDLTIFDQNRHIGVIKYKFWPILVSYTIGGGGGGGVGEMVGR